MDNNIVPPISQILMIEDRSSLVRCYSEFLKSENVDIISIPSGSEAIKFFEQHQEPRLVLLDLQLKDHDGLELLEFIKEKSPGSAVVVVTSNGSFEVSRKVINIGAIDYLEKPFTRDRLCITMRNALKHLELETATNQFGGQFCDFIGASQVMQNVYRIIELASASSKASVFITGESGTGKEVCSQAIHSLSDRRNNECVILNCAAIPKDLIESEIFGHMKGAFTGAVTNREGAATRAHKGTLFLDEIGEMDMDLQSKLLRVVQTGQFSKVGSNEIETVDVRFICATNRDPLVEIENSRFREDLYYRLNVIPITLPALRERGHDIVEIAEHFLKIFSEEEGKLFTALSHETKNLFMDYAWPGNVRQLLNVIRNVVVLNNDATVEVDMLPAPFKSPVNQATTPIASIPAHTQTITGIPSATQAIQRASISSIDKTPDTPPDTQESITPLWRVEMTTIDNALRICHGNITQAAKFLEINPSTIHRKRQAWAKSGVLQGTAEG